MIRVLWAGLCLTIILASAGRTESIPVSTLQRTTPVSFATEVSEVLDAKCVACHNQALAENKLTMEDVSGMLKGGKRGPSIIPGNADKSLLFQMAAHRLEPVMPPKAKKDLKPLTPDELGLLKHWIDAGAKDDSAEHEKRSGTLELGSLPSGVHPIVAVDMTTDGARVAAGRANTIQVYDVKSGIEIISLGGHQDIIQSIRYSPDGSMLAAGSYKLVTVWNAPTGRLVGTIDAHAGPVKAIAFNRLKQTLVTGSSDKTVKSWGNDPKGPSTPKLGKLVEVEAQKPFVGEVLSLAVSPQGDRTAVGLADGSIFISTQGVAIPVVTLKGHTGPVNDLVFVDQTHVVSVSSDGTARIWVLPSDPATEIADPFVLSGHVGSVRAVASSPDGSTIVTGGDDGRVRVWHAVDGKLIADLKIHEMPVLSVAISPDGRTLLTGSEDKTARSFDLATGKPQLLLTSHTGPVRSVTFSPSGERIATAGADGAVKIWESKTGRGVIAFGNSVPKGGVASPMNRVAFVAEDTFVTASNEKTVTTWTYDGTWSELRTFDKHIFRVLALDFHPDGSLLATGGGEPSRSGEIKIWELHKGFLVRQFETLHSDTVFGLKFSPDGSKLASAGADKFLKVVEVVGGKELKSFEGHTNHVLAVDWKSDGKQLITGGGDNVLKLWDFETGEQVRTMQGAGKQVTALRWVPGATRVVGASGDTNVRLWGTDNGSVQRTLNGPTDYVYGVAVSNDGKTIAAGGADGVLFLWDAESGQILHKLQPTGK